MPSVSITRSRGSGGEVSGEMELDGGGFVRLIGGGGMGVGCWSDVVEGSVGSGVVRCQRPRRPCLIAAAATGGTGFACCAALEAAGSESEIWRRCWLCVDALAASTFSLLMCGTTSTGSVLERRDMTVPSG